MQLKPLLALAFFVLSCCKTHFLELRRSMLRNPGRGWAMVQRNSPEIVALLTAFALFVADQAHWMTARFRACTTCVAWVLLLSVAVAQENAQPATQFKIGWEYNVRIRMGDGVNLSAGKYCASRCRQAFSSDLGANAIRKEPLAENDGAFMEWFLAIVDPNEEMVAMVTWVSLKGHRRITATGVLKRSRYNSESDRVFR